MTREDVKKIFPDASEEQITSILNNHNTEIITVKKSNLSVDELKKLKDKAKKYDEYEADKLTNEEKIQKALEEAELAKTENLKILNKSKAIQELVKGGFAEDDYKDFIDGIVSEDEVKTINMAKSMVNLLSKKNAEFETEYKNKQLEEMLKPEGGSDGDDISEAEQFAENLAKNQAGAVKSAAEARKYYMGGN